MRVFSNSVEGKGSVCLDWVAEKNNPYKFAGYEVSVHDEKAHTYNVYKFGVTNFLGASNFCLQAQKDLGLLRTEE